MSNWNETINISGLHRFYASGGISLQQVAKTIVRKLRLTEGFARSDSELIDIMCAFEAIDELAMLKDYNTVLEMLYAYGDKDHMLWVEAEGIDPQDSTEIAPKTKALFENEAPRYHGSIIDPTKQSALYHGPYLSPGGGGEWVQYPPKSDRDLDEWSPHKIYKTGDLVFKGSMKYSCKFSNSNSDPTKDSYKDTDAWKYLGLVDKNPSDPDLVLADKLACVVPSTGRNYGFTRKHHYMSEDDFNKKLIAANIVPATMPKDLYTYMKDCEEPYQEWLISRWHKENLTYRPAVSLNNN